MKFRTLLVGLLVGIPLGLFLAAYGYRNDWILQHTYVGSDLRPFSVYGFLVIGLLLLYPLLSLLKLNLNGAKWGVITALLLVACVIPGPGLMWTFTNTFIMPYSNYEKFPGWQQNRVLDYVPDVMLAGPWQPSEYYQKNVLEKKYDAETLARMTQREKSELYRAWVIEGFQNELSTDQAPYIAPQRVPWKAWARPLSFWVPLVGLFFIGSIALALTVHRQWSARERLRYPLAEVVHTLYEGSGDHAWPNVFRNRLFYFGMVPAFVVLVLNGFAAWGFTSITIPLNLDLSQALLNKWPELNKIQNVGPAVLNPSVLFAAVGFAYFLSSEVSFTLGISHLLFGAAWLFLLEAGANPQQDYFSGGLHSHQLFGSYLGMGLMVLYIGRRFYWNVVLNALMVPTADPAERHAIWGCRVALLTGIAAVVMLTTLAGLDPLLAVMFVMLVGLLFLMVTRLHVETGVFFIQPTWQAVGVLLGLFGITALGPKSLILLALLSSVITLDPRVTLMPMAANALRFCDRENVKPGALAPLMTLMLILALVVGVGFTLYWQYNDTGTAHGWLSWGASAPYKLLINEIRDLDPQQLGASFNLARWNPDTSFLTWAGVGLGLVLACSFLRLRFQWWPLHPALFLVWGTMPMGRVAPSFLLGWLLKASIQHFGGGEAYRKYKPVFVGLIAGALLAGFFCQMFAAAYPTVAGYFLEGDVGQLPRYVIHW